MSKNISPAAKRKAQARVVKYRKENRIALRQKQRDMNAAREKKEKDNKAYFEWVTKILNIGVKT